MTVLLAGASSDASTFVPQVLWVDGAVTAKPLGEGKARALELQPTDLLSPRARVVVPADGALWFLSTDQVVTGLHGPGTWELHPTLGLQGEGRRTAVPLEALRLDTEPRVPWVERERPREGDVALRPLSPLETGVTTRRPVLRWRTSPTVRRVSLTVSKRAPDGTLRTIERWRGLTGHHHEISRPLTPGADYRWELRVDGTDRDSGGDEVATTWFRVLSKEATQSVRRADAAISTSQLDHPEATRALEVVRALTWEHHGLATEARGAWDDIVARTGELEALRLYRARLDLRVLARPRALPPATVAPPEAPLPASVEP